MQKLSEHEYRKMFGLSYEDFLNEPFEEFMAHSMIASMVSDKTKGALKKRR